MRRRRSARWNTTASRCRRRRPSGSSRIDVREGQQVAGRPVAAAAGSRRAPQSATEAAAGAGADASARRSRNWKPARAAKTSRRRAPTSPPRRRRRAMRAPTTRACSRWVAQQLVAASEVDRARAAADNAAAQVRRGAGARCWNSKPARAASRSRRAKPRSRRPKAQAAAQQVTLDKLDVVAPRAGRRRQPAVQARRPGAGRRAAGDPAGRRRAVRARLRARTDPRQRARSGRRRARLRRRPRRTPLPARVRMIRNEPSFTPYYALIGEDAARLSYLAEVELDDGRRRACRRACRCASSSTQ